MDDQQKTDKQPADSPIEIIPTDTTPQADTPTDALPSNDLTPPPAPDETSVNIEVKTGSAAGEDAPVETTAADMTETTSDPDEVTPLVVEPPAETADTNEEADVVAAPAETEETEVEPEPTPVSDTPAETSANPEANSETAEPAAPQAAADNGEPAAVGVAASQMKAGQTHPHRNNKKLAAAVVVIVALLLAGTAVFVYLSANENTENTAQDTQTPSEQTAEATPATTQEVDSAIAEIDAAFEPLDDEADFADQDLSDSTLGL